MRRLNREKQDLVTSSAVGTLDIGLSYQFNRLTVRIYRGNRQFSLPATGASVDLKDDIGDVAADSFDLGNDIALQAGRDTRSPWLH
jgi:hypothetical protein